MKFACFRRNQRKISYLHKGPEKGDRSHISACLHDAVPVINLQKIRLTFARRIFHFICSGKLLVLAQLLVAFVSQLRELFGLGEEFLSFFREGLQQ